MSAHTPGPWAVSPLYSRVAYVIPAEHAARRIGGHADAAVDFVTYAQEICAIDCPDRHRSAEEMRANANLIAAAPDFLRAARFTLEQLDNFDARLMPAGLVGSIEMLKQAIAKAEGVSA